VYALESVFGTSTGCVSVCVGECVRDFNRYVSVCVGECVRDFNRYVSVCVGECVRDFNRYVSVCVGECVRDFNSVCECMRWRVCSGLQQRV